MANAIDSWMPQEPENIRFSLARAEGLTRYAFYETALASIFAHLMGAEPSYAGVAFFKINNARARIAIISRLLRKRYGSKFNVFWNSLEKLLPAFDQERNEIVHWLVADVRNLTSARYVLIPPNYWDWNENTAEKSIEDLIAFIDKSDFFGRLLNIFNTHLVGREEYLPNAWRDIYQQPVTYPPPETHPLLRSQILAMAKNPKIAKKRKKPAKK